MIPYIEAPPLMIGSFGISIRLLLVATAIVSGHFLLIHRLRRLGVQPHVSAAFSASMIFGGIFFAHLVKMFYVAGAWAAIRRNPSALLNVFNGQASFGGLLGGLGCGLLYLHLKGFKPRQILACLDTLAIVFSWVWIPGRLQCVLDHDHPGIRTDSWLGVRYPDAVRYDLAVIEVLFMIVVAMVLPRLESRRLQAGSVCGAFLIGYGLFRICLDQLHVDVLRYASLSVDQWASLATICCGAAMVWAGNRVVRTAIATEVPSPGR